MRVLLEPIQMGGTSEKWTPRTCFVSSTRDNDVRAHATPRGAMDLILNEADLNERRIQSESSARSGRRCTDTGIELRAGLPID